MSKAPLDSDLYGDIYGDDEFAGELELAELSEPVDPLSPKPESESGSPTTPTATKDGSTTEKSSSSTTHDGPSSLPPKPAPPGSNPSPALSYSAQIAQQFSTYQQTPSQERQQRSDIQKLSSSGDASGIFGKKPSEMHDAG
ncbi:hypothetical protein BDN72DRAFT_588152 [Pluteus cervinus]|uniref:Uncharacterized protein n=1 Tax=Pluteus cervinus TaxID=181527 RepID=A0ACD3AWS7_9AGAR|nr:hypothetical protein BDN72DRAFT_588152 [Pluteus cervinus]